MSELAVVVGIDEQERHQIDIDEWVRLAGIVLQGELVVGPAELNLTFVDSEEITKLNVQHMGSTGPTDVLAFPLDVHPNDDEAAMNDGQPRLLGDVVICPDVVVSQAPESPDDEMALMVVHGVLHIVGMDHVEADQATAMRASEQGYLTNWRAPR